jgi:hypothetical protein
MAPSQLLASCFDFVLERGLGVTHDNNRPFSVWACQNKNELDTLRATLMVGVLET